MRLFLKKKRRDSVQQLQLNLANDGEIALDPVVEEQLVKLMAEMMLAVVLRGKETGDDHRSTESHIAASGAQSGGVFAAVFAQTGSREPPEPASSICAS